MYSQSMYKELCNRYDWNLKATPCRLLTLVMETTVEFVWKAQCSQKDLKQK